MKRDLILIVLIVICTLTALNKVSRISNRKAQQQRIKLVRRPVSRELRL